MQFFALKTFLSVHENKDDNKTVEQTNMNICKLVEKLLKHRNLFKEMFISLGLLYMVVLIKNIVVKKSLKSTCLNWLYRLAGN